MRQGKKTVEIIDMMRSQGWVTRTELCKLIGMADGGNIPKLLKDNEVRSVMVNRDVG